MAQTGQTNMLPIWDSDPTSDTPLPTVRVLGGAGGEGGGGDASAANQVVGNAILTQIEINTASGGDASGANQVITNTRLGDVTETAPATDTASSGLNGRLQRAAQRLTSLIALLPASIGTKTAAASLSVTMSSDGPFVTQTGALTETAPATDTASSGLNGRLQRIAQRLTSLLADTASIVTNTAAAGAIEGKALDNDPATGKTVRSGGTYRSTVPTYTDGDIADLGMDSRGNLRVKIYDAGNASSLIADNADDVAAAATLNGLKVVSRNTVFDGTTWDRAVQSMTTTQGASAVSSLSAMETSLAATSPVAVQHDTAGISLNGVALTPKFVKIQAASSGDNTILVAVTSKKIRVLGYNLIANGAVNAKFQSGAGGTDLTGLKYFPAAGAGISVGFSPIGWLETASGVLLNLNLSAAVAVGGELVYVEV